MSPAVLQAKLDSLEARYSGPIEQALARGDYRMAERLGADYDRCAARLTAASQAKAPFRLRRMTAARGA